MELLDDLAAIEPRADSAAAEEAQALFAAHRRRLWAIAYRMTGSAADADDVVQECFARWLARSPERDARPAIAWLVRVATNLATDALRARRRRAYPGTWLPSPVEIAPDDSPSFASSPELDPAARYGRLESATLAFLVAIEALAPRPRAVLLLRNVFGYSAAETADLVATSAGNVRILHLRARRAMEVYDRARCIPTAELRARHRAALDRFLACLAAQDEAALIALLSDSMRTSTDAGGEYTALRAPLPGRVAVARFYVRAARNRAASGPTVEIRLLNGLPGALLLLAHPVRRQAPRTLLTLEVDDEGRICEIRTVLASRKTALGAHAELRV